MQDTVLRFHRPEEQGNTKSEAIEDTKKAIKLCRSYLQKKLKNTDSSSSKLITISV